MDEAEANSHEAEVEAKIALIFSAKFYILAPFSQKNKIFGRFSTGLQKFRLKTGLNMGTLLVNTRKTTSYAVGRRLYCFGVYILYKKCHILSVNVTKHFNRTSKILAQNGL